MKDLEAYHLAWEAIERAAAATAKTQESREEHLLQAERHADRAWSIREGFDEDDDIAVDDDWVGVVQGKSETECPIGLAVNELARGGVGAVVRHKPVQSPNAPRVAAQQRPPLERTAFLP